MGWKEPDNKDRDPWDGHSDLDELLAQVKRRFAKRFGGGGSGSFRPRIWWVVTVILIGIWLLYGVYEVGAGKRAVILRFGHYVGTVGTGVHWHLPWPITETKLVDVKQSRSITRNATLVSRDKQLVTAAVTVKYHITHPFRYLYASANPSQVLDSWADSVLMKLVESHTQSELQSLKKSQQKIDLDKTLTQRIKAIDPGITVDGVTLTRLKPPEAVAQARSKAEAKLKQSASAAESAQSAAQASIAQARNKAGQLIAQANSEAKARETRAQAEVARFKALVPAWRKHPHETENYLRNESIREALTAAPKIVVSGSVRVVQLPPAAFTGSQAPAAATKAPPKKQVNAAKPMQEGRQ